LHNELLIFRSITGDALNRFVVRVNLKRLACGPRIDPVPVRGNWSLLDHMEIPSPKRAIVFPHKHHMPAFRDTSWPEQIRMKPIPPGKMSLTDAII
jgi:hypothetical protein